MEEAEEGAGGPDEVVSQSETRPRGLFPEWAASKAQGAGLGWDRTLQRGPGAAGLEAWPQAGQCVVGLLNGESQVGTQECACTGGIGDRNRRAA